MIANTIISLENLRKKNNYSFLYMANKLNISKTYYWQIEKGQRRLSYHMAIKISDIFGLKPDCLFYKDAKKRLQAPLMVSEKLPTTFTC